MAKRLLPLNGLRAFEATARLGSFTAASAELAVTPGAVSQLVRALERQLDLILFDRRPQSLVPTPAARELLPVLTGAFDAMDAAIRRLRAPAAATVPLAIACPAGFASGWLLPRLEAFSGAHPGIALSLSATERLVEPGEAGIDACIRFGRAGWPGTLSCDFLFIERRMPVCSPAYLAAHPFGDGLDDQILLESLPGSGDWADWMSVQGRAPQEVARLSFGDERLAVEAAIAGLGLALCDRALIAEPLQSGRLVAPLEPLEMVRGTAWYLVYPAEPTPAVATLSGWLQDQIEGPVL
ncbi:MAG TPA: LysR substrate-binding domain-containing protein [Aliidongia sp.]|nr:LysR substrate-binding domain-containing protein [Aliidongia sp.]